MQTVVKIKELESLLSNDSTYLIRGKEVTANDARIFVMNTRSKGISDFNIAKLITVCKSQVKLVQLINQPNYVTTNYFQQSYG